MGFISRCDCVAAQQREGSTQRVRAVVPVVIGVALAIAGCGSAASSSSTNSSSTNSSNTGTSAVSSQSTQTSTSNQSVTTSRASPVSSGPVSITSCQFSSDVGGDVAMVSFPAGSPNPGVATWQAIVAFGSDHEVVENYYGAAASVSGYGAPTCQLVSASEYENGNWKQVQGQGPAVPQDGSAP